MIRIIWIIGGLITLFILLSLATNLLKFNLEKELKVEGIKVYVVNKITSLAKECLNENLGKKERKVCFEVRYKSKEEIKKEDFKADFLEGIDLGTKGKILIIYENGKVYLEKIEYERISS